MTIANLMVNASLGGVFGAVGGLACYALNKKIANLSYLKALHNPVFASLPLLKAVGITSACWAFFCCLNMSFQDNRKELSKSQTENEAKNYLYGETAIFFVSGIATLAIARQAGLVGNYATAFWGTCLGLLGLEHLSSKL